MNKLQFLGGPLATAGLKTSGSASEARKLVDPSGSALPAHRTASKTSLYANFPLSLTARKVKEEADSRLCPGRKKPTMELRGWRFTSFLCVLLSLIFQASAFTHISTNLCKWCDQSNPVCEDNICMSNCNFSSFCTYTEEVCVAIWKKENESLSVQTLCHNPQHALENIVLPNTSSTECAMTSVPSENSILYLCSCIREHDCNDRLIFEKGFSRLQSKDVIPVVVLSLAPPLLVAVIATMAFYVYRTRHLSKQPKDWPPKRTHYQSLDPPQACAGEVNASDYHGKLLSLGEDANSDISSSCANSLNHNTEHLPIQLEALVGKGRFAEVWRARLNHSECGQYETVAVKIFPSVEYASWRNERAIFSDPNLKHENIVQFLTAEQRGGTASNPQRQYWLIMAYHALGNLQDYLVSHVLSWSQLCAMASSVARGLAHLHNDTTPCGTPKVPIAHRDLKSSNIVMKTNNECALCDFGLALRLDISLTVDDFANSGQVGTARYMAPEVLESRVNLEDLESFKQMDVYSMSLVLWEIASRCDAIGEVKSYEPPFGSKVCDQPCVDSMRDLVLRDRGRPDIPLSWTIHTGMQVLSATITECWDHDPEARLTAHCVLERFNSLAQEELETSAVFDPIPTSTVQQDSPLPSNCTEHDGGTAPACPSQTQAAADAQASTSLRALSEV
ncbi:TGF-beta receptor type-2 isoform X2 [Silurus meridionalis]|uniref:TGF-beta receptor type-2 isoform X2 n=1 Tax=Silurus meridionalis TaxID=175797 RepID=UPI001EECC4C5|nr:TGF-beta receptor type-2 isoform X2 [Silurus meridionalis]